MSKPTEAGQNASTDKRAASPHPLDGSQYHNIIEEQEYAERRPTPDEQAPWRIAHPLEDPTAPHTPPAPTISVGPK